MSRTTVKDTLDPFLDLRITIDWTDSALPVAPISRRTAGLEANAKYFGHPLWAKNYFTFCHRSDRFRSRWQAVAGCWDDKVVVDIGCGPGNVFATVGGRPKRLIGIDVSPGGLEMARAVGYTPIVGDAHALPFISNFADLVILNATLHHCDDMAGCLKEAARIVRPGGVLITDHDPQLSAWDFRGVAKLLWDFRLTAYLWLKKGFHRSTEEQSLVLRSEIHHEPGDGVSSDFFFRHLKPMGFDVEIFPHNHNLGAEVLEGDIGRSEFKFRIAQRLSGLNPNSREAALSLLCRARKNLSS